MMKDCSLIDSKYTSQLLDNDIARVLGKLTTGTALKLVLFIIQKERK